MSLDDLANDGETGEGDNVKSTVEDVRGGAGADTLLGSGAANRLIAGGDGADILRATKADAVANVLRGFDGDDTLNSREGTATVDSLLCGPGAGDRFAKDPADTQGACEVALP